MKNKYHILFLLSILVATFSIFISSSYITKADSCSDCKTFCTSGGQTAAQCTASCASSCVATSTTSTSGDSTEFVNPLKFSTVEEFLANILAVGRSIIVILALVFLVIGALFYVTSAGNPDMTKKAKAAISGSLIGLALGIAAPSFLKEIGDVLGWTAVDTTPLADALTLTQIATNILAFLMSVLGVISLIMLMIGSIMYLTSAGDDDRIKTGKAIFKYALLGIIIAMSALIVVRQLAMFFV